MNVKLPQNKNNFRYKIEKLYYNYGKFCASHPILILAGVISVIIISCYPLLNTSFHSNTPFHQRKIFLNDLVNLYSEDKKLIGYVQQIIVQNHAELVESDINNPIEIVYEALSECFKIVNEIKFRHDYLEACLETGDINLNDKSYNLFPTFSCLFLSPLQLWEMKTDKFSSDGNILKTINSRKRFIKEMFFGLPWLKTGISSVFTKKKNHKINYAITFLLKKYDKTFLDSLFAQLKAKYNNISVHEPTDSGEELLYNNQTYLSSHLPLLITYLILMLYVYFSVRKIEMVKSKLGLAFSACFTVAASLYMSLGICIYIGIIVPSLPGSEIFPYLVVIIGLENTLVITKSIVATPVDLPVKHRIAQGLEKEGWAISKNLISEIFILSLGIFTFNPAIQEFFLLALIGLSTDFFLQITFFVTVLSIDMRRMELSDIRDCYHNQLLNSINEESSLDWHLGKYNRDSFIIYLFRWIKDQSMSFGNNYLFKEKLEKSNISKGHKRKASDINTAAFIQSDGMVPVYIPRRLIFLYFWAKNRIFQRLVMIVAAVWILFIILYSTNLFHSVFLRNIISLPLQPDIHIDLTDDWKLLAMHHWPRLAQIYSINITDRKLFVLPSWNLLNDIKITPKALVDKDPFSKDHQRNNWLSSQILSGTNDLFMQIPSSLRGWADLSLTFKMVLASIVGMGIVLMSTALIMTLFQALQSISGDNREPVLRILPLKIDTEFAVPPGANCISCGPIIMANGLEIYDPINIAFKIKSWNIDTGQLLEEKHRKGVWDIVYIENNWIMLGFDSGIVELWRRSADNINVCEIDSINLTRGGILKMFFWINEHCVFAATIDGWMIVLTIRNNKIQINNSTKVFIETIKDFHVSSSYKLAVCSNKSIKIYQLPSLTLIESLSLISEPILASHFVDSFLAATNGSLEISLVDTTNFKKTTWNWTSLVHWIKCCPANLRSSKTTVVTFDINGAICLWLLNRKKPIRQILIDAPSVVYPGPISLINNSLIFADKGYLRLFNVHLNKYERSIQILGSKSIKISEVYIAAEKWIVCLNQRKEFIVLPISTVE